MDEVVIQQSTGAKLKRFINECFRVLQITKKPDRFEYKSIVKASALGIGVLGVIGFLIYMVKVIILG